MGKQHDEEGYWESEPFTYDEMTCDKVIEAIFESGAPGNAFFLMNGVDTMPPKIQIIVAWGDEWQVMNVDDTEYPV